MKTEPNAPAKPCEVSYQNDGTLKGAQTSQFTGIEIGLTKREHFAGLAMQGYISADYTANSGMPFDSMAEWSVKMADYLIAELNKTQP